MPEQQRRTNGQRYPWEQWLDGQIWRSPGARTSLKPETFRRSVYLAAERIDKKVLTRVIGRPAGDPSHRGRGLMRRLAETLRRVVGPFHG